MPTSLTLPFVMAALFTGGWIVIHKLEKHAERVEEFLIIAFLLTLSIIACGLIGNYMNYSGNEHQKRLVLRYKSNTYAADEEKYLDFGTD